MDRQHKLSWIQFYQSTNSTYRDVEVSGIFSKFSLVLSCAFSSRPMAVKQMNQVWSRVSGIFLVRTTVEKQICYAADRWKEIYSNHCLRSLFWCCFECDLLIQPKFLKFPHKFASTDWLYLPRGPQPLGTTDVRTRAIKCTYWAESASPNETDETDVS